MPKPKPSPRAEHRRQQGLRISASPCLAERFSQLKSLTVELTYLDTEKQRKTSIIKYRANLTKAHSVFSFSCPNADCVGGDFDLSEPLAGAIEAHQSSTMGELACPGRRSLPPGEETPCPCVLHYSLTLELRRVAGGLPRLVRRQDLPD